MVAHPVLEGQLILRQTGQDAAELAFAVAGFCLHFGNLCRNARIVLVLVVRNKQIQLGMLFDGNTEVVKRLDGTVAGEKIVRTRSESKDFEPCQTDKRGRNGNKFTNLCSDFCCGAARIRRDVNALAAQTEVVGGVEHAAVSVAATVVQVAVALGG